MNNKAQIKKNIKQALFDKLGCIQGVISVTLVGSFVNQRDLSGISDIDTIVICKSLDKKLFDTCMSAVNNIDLKKCGLNNYTLKINSSFGPLKFDEPNLAVIHLMIYDINAHKHHVLASPFTCFDWERSETIEGPSLKEIFPIGALQFRDFVEVRRSMENYIDDLSNNVISYREYSFKNGKVTETKKSKSLDKRHRGEYAYHIIRNLIVNYLKLCSGKNKSYSNEQVETEIKRLLPETGGEHAKRFDTITRIKAKRKNDFPANTTEWTKTFLAEFQKGITNEWSEAMPIQFIRHYKTNLNDGTYLGQGRDPGINIINKQMHCNIIDKIYSSPLKRCIETVEYIFTDSEIITDERLFEFNYGKAEGLSYKQLVMEYPEVSVAWQNSKDPNFPEGENTKDVNKRLNSFLNDLSHIIINNPKVSIGVVTHNGILRCLLGNAFGLEMKEWYKLTIPHGVLLEFLFFQNRFYPNIPRTLWTNILQNIGYSIA
ncbi:MAG: histidine phosphatase family protein [Candidatus Marinimicrobia bacterium]|jgi:ribonuclease H / adenosylcobalamin/alpha-ribazole phosphatase|nr:histidine phosphatase family protein [Candidatus Neomarinimicrobiota bacterium]